jgi:hypothetical protein
VGVERGPGGGEFDGGAGGGVDAEQSAVQGEGGGGEVGGGRVAADPGGDQPGALAQPPLDGGQFVAPTATARGEHGRVGDQALLAGGEVEQLEAVERILGTGRAEQQQPGTVLGEGVRAWGAVGEPTGTGAEGEEGVGDGHGPMVVVRCSPDQ